MSSSFESLAVGNMLLITMSLILIGLFYFFFFFEDAIYAVYFSLALRSTIHHGIQLILGMNQEGNPFALVETEIHD